MMQVKMKRFPLANGLRTDAYVPLYLFFVPSVINLFEHLCHNRSASGDLALLTQQSDVDLLDPYIYLSWIGLCKTGNTWRWSDGTSYVNSGSKWVFGSKDTNGDCAAANSTGGR